MSPAGPPGGPYPPGNQPPPGFGASGFGGPPGGPMPQHGPGPHPQFGQPGPGLPPPGMTNPRPFPPGRGGPRRPTVGSLILGIVLVAIAVTPAVVFSNLLLFFPLSWFMNGFTMLASAATVLPLLGVTLITLIRRVAQVLIVLGGVGVGVLVGVVFGSSAEAPDTGDWVMAVCLGLGAIALIVLPFVPPLSWAARGGSAPPPSSGGPGPGGQAAPGWQGGPGGSNGPGGPGWPVGPGAQGVPGGPGGPGHGAAGHGIGAPPTPPPGR